MGRFSKLERDTPPPDGAPPPAVPVLPAGAPPPAAAAEPPPADYPSFIERADAHFYRGEFDKALRFYSRALQLESAHQYPWIGQVSCLLEMKQLNEADLWTQRGLELFPEDPALLSLRALVTARRGMIKRALGLSDYALTRGADLFCWIARGEILLRSSSENANFCFEKAMEAAGPEDWKTPFRIGLICYHCASWAMALEYFQKSAARNAANFWLWYLLGQCLDRLSFRREAIDALEHSITLNPGYPPARDALRNLTRRSLLARFFRLFSGRKKAP